MINTGSKKDFQMFRSDTDFLYVLSHCDVSGFSDWCILAIAEIYLAERCDLFRIVYDDLPSLLDGYARNARSFRLSNNYYTLRRILTSDYGSLFSGKPFDASSITASEKERLSDKINYELHPAMEKLYSGLQHGPGNVPFGMFDEFSAIIENLFNGGLVPVAMMRAHDAVMAQYIISCPELEELMKHSLDASTLRLLELRVFKRLPNNYTNLLWDLYSVLYGSYTFSKSRWNDDSKIDLMYGPHKSEVWQILNIQTVES